MEENWKQTEETWDAVDLPVVLLRAEGDCQETYENPAAAALRNRVDEKADSVLELMPEEDREELLRQVQETGSRQAPLFCHIGKEVYSVTLMNQKECCVCILQDASQYYYKNKNAMEEAQLANRAKTNFLFAMSHDIRTPMNAIVGMTSIALKQEEIQPRVKDCLEKIQTASEHMMSLLNDVLDMSRIESGKILLQPEKVNLADLLHEILIVAKPQASSKGLQLQVLLGEVLQEDILADGVRIGQICNNLLSNAVKFTPEGGKVELYLSVSHRTESFPLENGEDRDLILTIRVRDTGIGIAKEFVPHIFQPFEREKSVTVSKIQGTGLGMAITRNLVNMMNGRIAVDSEEGKGTCFEVEIPVKGLEGNQETCRQSLQDKWILFLDDEERQGSAVTEMLRSLGLQVEWVKNAEETVDAINQTIFAEREFFAFLTVETVKGMEMVEFLPQVRSRMGENFPILMLSAEDWTQLEYLLSRAGVNAYIPLPLFKSRLLTGLYAFTEESRQESLRRKSMETKKGLIDKKVLLVEDNELNREIAQEILEMAEVSVEAAENGAEAVEKFRSSPSYYYDMIFMDIQMPVMDGLQATRAIRALDRGDAGSVPIVAMTANAFLEDVKNSLEAGMNGHLSKPLDMDQVHECMKKFLGGEG